MKYWQGLLQKDRASGYWTLGWTVPFSREKKTFFLISIESVKSNFQLGEFDLHLPFWIVQVPFCQTKLCLFILVKSIFPRRIWLNSLNKQFINSHHILHTFILWSIIQNEVYDIKSERWSWKRKIQWKFI